MRYLFTYDIPSSRKGDNRRAKLSRCLGSYGLRVQFSVFELDLDPVKLPVILEELEGILDASEDSLRVYPFCGTCRDRAIRVGVEAPCEHQSLLIW